MTAGSSSNINFVNNSQNIEITNYKLNKSESTNK